VTFLFKKQRWENKNVKNFFKNVTNCPANIL